MSAIEVTNLVKKFHGQTVLHGIDLEVKPGEVVAIIGRAAQGRQRYYAALTCWNNRKRAPLKWAILSLIPPAHSASKKG